MQQWSEKAACCRSCSSTPLKLVLVLHASFSHDWRHSLASQTEDLQCHYSGWRYSCIREDVLKDVGFLRKRQAFQRSVSDCRYPTAQIMSMLACSSGIIMHVLQLKRLAERL